MKSWIDLPFLIKNWYPPLTPTPIFQLNTQRNITQIWETTSPLSFLALTRHPDRPEGTTSEGMDVYLVRKGATVREDIPYVG